MTPKVLPFGFPHSNRYQQGARKNSLRSNISGQTSSLMLITFGGDKRGSVSNQFKVLGRYPELFTK